MNARGYLELLIEENPTDEHSAALRELDQLLADVTNWLLNSDYEDSRAELISRLAQAGYGESSED